MNNQNDRRWISFAKIREQLNFENVLRSHNVRLKQKKESDQHVGPCPLPNHGEKAGDTFSANYEKKLWQCFGCKQSGNIIDFEVIMGGGDKKNNRDVRAAALHLQEQFLDGNDAKNKEPDSAAKKPNVEQTSKAPRLPEGKRAEGRSQVRTPSTVVNPPLDFALKTLDAAHPYFADHKLSPDTVSRFKLGFCTRGTLKGRVAIPLEDDQGQLVGYAGLIAHEESVTSEDPKFVFPAGREIDGVPHIFDRSKFLYNGFRIKQSVKDLIVVLECHVVWALWQAGFANVVSLMGYEVSPEHMALINMATVDSGHIWVLTDESLKSSLCARSLLHEVARTRSCRWVRVENQDAIAPDHPLLAVLPKR